MQSKNSLIISISLLVFLALALQTISNNSQNWGLSQNVEWSDRTDALSNDPAAFEINTSRGGVQTDQPHPEKDAPLLVATIASGAGMIGGSVRLSNGSEFSFGSRKVFVHRDIQKAQIVAAQKSREFTLLGLKPSGVS